MKLTNICSDDQTNPPEMLHASQVDERLNVSPSTIPRPPATILVSVRQAMSMPSLFSSRVIASWYPVQEIVRMFQVASFMDLFRSIRLQAYLEEVWLAAVISDSLSFKRVPREVGVVRSGGLTLVLILVHFV